MDSDRSFERFYNLNPETLQQVNEVNKQHLKLLPGDKACYYAMDRIQGPKGVDCGECNAPDVIKVEP